MGARTGGVFALDLSSATGWAYGCPDDPAPLNGVWLLTEGYAGRLFASFENELEDAIVLHRPALILSEAPLPPTTTSTAVTWRQQLGLAALAETAAYRHDIDYREVASSTIRADVLGTARFPNGKAKSAVLAYCQAQGWRVPDDNAGDACLAWKYACRHLPASARARSDMRRVAA